MKWYELILILGALVVASAVSIYATIWLWGVGHG